MSGGSQFTKFGENIKVEIYLEPLWLTRATL